MQGNLPDDNLEEFFRKAFKEEESLPQGEGWDEPSPFAWNAIEDSINSTVKPGWTVVKKVGIGILVLLLGFVGWLIYHNQQLQQRLRVQAEIIEELQPNTYQDNQSTNKKSSIFINPTQEESAALAPAYLPPAKIPPKTAKLQSGNSPVSSNNSIPLEETSPSEEGVNVNQTFRPLKVETILPSIHTIDQVDKKLDQSQQKVQQKLQHIPTPPVAAVQSPSTSLTNFNVPKLRKKSKPDHRWVFSLTGGTNFTKSRLVTHRNTPFHHELARFFKKQEKGSWSSEIGVKASYQITNRLAIQSGISRYQLKQKSNKNLRLPYDQDKEQPINDTQFESNQSLTFPSSYGDTEVEVIVTRSDEAETENLRLNVNATHELVFSSIPLLLDYKIIQGKWNLSVKGGGAVNFLHKAELHTSGNFNAHPDIFVRQIKMRQRPPQQNKNTFDALAGLSLQYRITPLVSVNLEPTFRHSIRPIIKDEHFSANAYAIGAQLGLSVHL